MSFLSPGARIGLVGHSGAGKSTAARLLRDHLLAQGVSVSILKVAKPLYGLQMDFYKAAGMVLDSATQDQLLLEAIARELRRISPVALIDRFKEAVDNDHSDVILNDDVRDIDVDLPRMLAMGFVFIRIQCNRDLRAKRVQRRGDISSALDSTTTQNLDRIPIVATVNNDTEDPNAFLSSLLSAIKGDPA